MELVDLAQLAARQAGDILMSMFGRLEPDAIEFKGEIDLVTKADKEAERCIIQRVREQFPTHGFWAEESGITSGAGEYVWVIDPLDGTTNYAHGFPFFAVSIGVRRGEETVLGVVYDCYQDRMYSAELGSGAYCNGDPIHVARVEDVKSSLFVTGVPYSLCHIDAYVHQTKSLLLRSRGMRRIGSAALSLCAVANGTFSGYWEFGLKPWDVAAGALLVEEAGGTVSDFAGEKLDLQQGHLVATNAKVHAALLAALAE